MRKTLVMLLSVFLATLFSMSMIRPAQADINHWMWLPPYIDKKDGSYIIYKHLSTAELKVPVYNNFTSIIGATYGLNVSKVIISFDWGGATSNKTLDPPTSPVKIEWHQTYIFAVSFVANATEAVSSAWQHTYTIYVEHVNGAGVRVGTLSRAWDYFGGSNKWKFIVYSTDQADALDLQTRYNSSVTSYPLTYFNATDARQLAGQAQIEGSVALSDYNDRQDYASAHTRYQTALDLYAQALAAENDYRTAYQDALLNTTLTRNAAALIEANAAMRQANASKIQAEVALTNAYGFYFIGIGFAIGWTFIGIGVIVYALRRPKPPA